MWYVCSEIVGRRGNINVFDLSYLGHVIFAQGNLKMKFEAREALRSWSLRHCSKSKTNKQTKVIVGVCKAYLWWGKVPCCSFWNNSLLLCVRGFLALTLPKLTSAPPVLLHQGTPFPSSPPVLIPTFLKFSAGDSVSTLSIFLNSPIQQVGSPKFSL